MYGKRSKAEEMKMTLATLGQGERGVGDLRLALIGGKVRKVGTLHSQREECFYVDVWVWENTKTRGVQKREQVTLTYRFYNDAVAAHKQLVGLFLREEYRRLSEGALMARRNALNRVLGDDLSYIRSLEPGEDDPWEALNGMEKRAARKRIIEKMEGAKKRCEAAEAVEKDAEGSKRKKARRGSQKRRREKRMENHVNYKRRREAAWFLESRRCYNLFEELMDICDRKEPLVWSGRLLHDPDIGPLTPAQELHVMTKVEALAHYFYRR